VFIAAIITIIGPAYAAFKHQEQLESRGVDTWSPLLILAVVGFQVWPLHLLVLWKHYGYRKEAMRNE
jgi:hypothetical protein